MSKCVHCHGRKGKRSCPALSGSICSLCCGEHRLKTIACPSDCTYLGGISAVLAKDAGSISFTREVWERATEELYRTALESKGRDLLKVALADFGLELAPEEWEAPVLLGYATHVLKDDRGRRYLDRFLDDRARLLSGAEVAALRAHGEAWASLFEIVEVRAGEGMTLKDLIEDRPLEIKDTTESPLVTPGDYVYGWVMTAGDHLEMTGEVCIVPAEHRQAALDGFRHAIEARKAEAPSDAPRVRELVAWAIPKAIRAARAAAPEQAAG